MKGPVCPHQQDSVKPGTTVLVARPLQHHQAAFVIPATTVLCAVQYRHVAQPDAISHQQVARPVWHAQKDGMLMSSVAMRLRTASHVL